MKRALLVIDMQEQFFKMGTVVEKSLNDAVEYINAAIEYSRENDIPVIAIEHMDKEDGLVPGSAGFSTHHSIKLEESDLRITKEAGSGFYNTNLTEKLKEMDVESVIITGFCAEYCVLSTTRGAADSGFKPIILRNSLASFNPENIEFVEKINDVISFGALCTL